VDSIQAAHDMSESEISYQSIRHSVTNDSSKRPFQIQFQPVAIFESAESEGARLIAAETSETDKSLL
jgi:hypothetical protein